VHRSFARVDFHIHTPISKCYSDGAASFRQIAEAAVKAGLHAIAVTDHNSCEAVEYVQRHTGNGCGDLVVFPGVELSTEQGHVLAVFDVGTPKARLEGLLDAVGLPPEARGDGTVLTQSSMEEVLHEIDTRGGLAIAAHIERWPSGFLETNASRKTKMRIHCSRHLTALEITQPANKGLWTEGKMRYFPKKYPCVQGSDAHTPQDIGRRPTLIRLHRLDLDGLREAFDRPASWIRFPQELE